MCAGVISAVSFSFQRSGYLNRLPVQASLGASISLGGGSLVMIYALYYLYTVKKSTFFLLLNASFVRPNSIYLVRKMFSKILYTHYVIFTGALKVVPSQPTHSSLYTAAWRKFPALSKILENHAFISIFNWLNSRPSNPATVRVLRKSVKVIKSANCIFGESKDQRWAPKAPKC
jgi:hypothetical protein